MTQLAIFNESKKRTHIAIMKKSWGLTKKILTGEKTIESRWYKNRYRPWNHINAGDDIYFKDSGEPVTVKANVHKVFQFENLNPQKVREILLKYAKDDGLGIESGQIEKFYEMFKNKRFCLIIFLKGAKKIKPFNIDKSGFGSQAAWLVVKDIDKIKKRL